jgi:hypothetical protein
MQVIADISDGSFYWVLDVRMREVTRSYFWIITHQLIIVLCILLRGCHTEMKPNNDQENTLLGVFAIRKHILDHNIRYFTSYPKLSLFKEH